MSSRYQLPARKITNLEEDIEAPKDKASPSPTKATASLSPNKEDNTKPIGIITLLKDIIAGIILGVILVSTSIILDYRNVIHFQSAHHFRNATFQVLSSPETMNDIEQNSELKFMEMNEYESNRKEIDSVAEKLAFRNEDLGKRTVEAQEKHKEIESIESEHNRLMLIGNTQFDLDKFCGGCVWAGPTSCDERVSFMKRTYNLGTIAAKVSAMGIPTCIKK